MVQGKTRATAPSTKRGTKRGAKRDGRSAKEPKRNPKATRSGDTHAMSFAAYLAQIGALVAKHGSSLELRAPAKPKELRKLEMTPSVLVPAELGAAWRTTDGCSVNLFAHPKLLTGYQFLSVSDAIKARAGFATRASRYVGYEQPRPRDPRIAPGWYHPGWLPFAAFGGASLVLLVDASPSARGRAGQIIAFTHDPDEITYVAASFPAFLAATRRWIEAHPEDILDLQ